MSSNAVDDDGMPTFLPGMEPSELSLTERVHAGFAPQIRKQIPLQEVEQVLSEVDLTERRIHHRAPQLVLRRLRLKGTKNLVRRDIEVPVVAPIDYEQAFELGVNVLLVEKNGVGKSSVLKSIKFALTGDHSDYDNDVRGWITGIWLHFTLGQDEFTTVLSNEEGKVRMVLANGDVDLPIEEAASLDTVEFDEGSPEAIKDALQEFFFGRLHLRGLLWTQTDAAKGTIAERSTSWATYWQALHIPAKGDQYLICDDEHATAGQDGLIVSTYLGLQMAEPLNRLLSEINRVKNEIGRQQSLTVEEEAILQGAIAGMQAEVEEKKKAVGIIDQKQRARRGAMIGSDAAKRLAEIQGSLLTSIAKQRELDDERRTLGESIRRKRSKARLIRENVALELHFTGLDVKLCPNCEAEVDETAVRIESEVQRCRLCGKPAHAASPEEIEALKAEAKYWDDAADSDSHGRDALGKKLEALRGEIALSQAEAARLEVAARRDLTWSMPTEEEDAERALLHEQVGRLLAQIEIMSGKIGVAHPDLEALDRRRRILEKARAILRGDADGANEKTLRRLGATTEELTGRFGVESIGDIVCSAVGKVLVKKHGVTIRFSSIRNEGERLRLKLAFFIAMIAMGREPGYGRHPGLLLIDQPGSTEMVPADQESIAAALREIDTEKAKDLQIIVFTTSPFFAAATDPSRVYGPHAGEYVF